MTTKTDKKNAYELVTDMILEKIEAGVAPWIKPWNQFNPRNLVSQKEYRGINNTILSLCAGDSSYYLTFKQAKSMGGTVVKGSESIPVIFHNFKDLDEPDERGRDRIYCGARYYRVFKVEDTTLNGEQLKGLIDEDDYTPLDEEKRVEKIEDALLNFCEGINVKVVNKDNSAYYQPIKHVLNMPKYEKFKTIDGYYATFFHELIHATSKDLGRDVANHFGSKDYSFEELVAELGSAYLCSMFQVDNTELEQSASYIKGWASKFKDDKKMIFKASSFAQQAVDHLINKLDKSLKF
jgi:antirestriction protein ArdC